MKKNYILAFICILFFTVTAFAQSNTKDVADSLNRYILPIVNPNAPAADYSGLVNHLKSKEIVSLGESTHGTKDYYEAKAELIKGLIQEGNFKTVFMETEYCAMLPLNEVLQNSADTSLQRQFRLGIYGIYKTNEVYNLFEFIKKYNATRNEAEKVAVIGIDMQGADNIANSVLRLLPDSGKNDMNIYTSLMSIKNEFSTGKLHKFSKDENEGILKMIATLKDKASKDQDKNFIFLMRILEQSYSQLAIKSYPVRTNFRDKYMAENIVWLKENMRNNSKSIFWGHNGHIANIESSTHRVPTGSYLKTMYKDKAFSIGLYSGEGTVRILDSDPKYKGYVVRNYEPIQHENAIENVFMQCNSPVFFLDLKQVQSNGYLTREIKYNTYMRFVGARYYKNEKSSVGKENLLDSYDGVLFFRKTTAAVAVPVLTH